MKFSGKILYQIEKAIGLPAYLIPGHGKRRYKTLYSALRKLVAGDDVPVTVLEDSRTVPRDRLIKDYASYSMKVEKRGLNEEPKGSNNGNELDDWEHHVLTFQNLGPKLIYGAGAASLISGYDILNDPNLHFLNPRYAELATTGLYFIFFSLVSPILAQSTQQETGKEFIEDIKNLPEDKMLKLKHMVMAGRTDEREIERAIEFLRTEC
ncbi:MAG: hypothetical protein V3U72_00265 [Candidatus Aenigmarchaeota archaeon]